MLGLGLPMIASLRAHAYSKACPQKKRAVGFRRPGQESGPVVVEEGVDPIGDTLDEASQEVRGHAARHLRMQFDEDEL
jgi:hypothetical protein